jgi:transcription elongation factor Elf1
MECKICGKDACQHPRLHVHDNIYECLDCGQCGANTPPIKYALPFYEGKVDWHSDVYFFVCRNCYYEVTHDPRAYPLDKLGVK